MNLTGIEFGEKIEDYKDRESRPCYRLIITNVLPEHNENLIIWNRTPCSTCGAIHEYVFSEIAYDKEKLAGVCDFNLTKEFINNPRNNHKVIISKKARKFFLDNKIRLRDTPVFVPGQFD